MATDRHMSYDGEVSDYFFCPDPCGEGLSITCGFYDRCGTGGCVWQGSERLVELLLNQLCYPTKVCGRVGSPSSVDAFTSDGKVHPIRAGDVESYSSMSVRDNTNSTLVIEFGCGAGLPGLVCAKRFGVPVILTDSIEEVLNVCNLNVSKNSLQYRIDVMRFDWNRTDDLQALSDFTLSKLEGNSIEHLLLIGADLIYEEMCPVQLYGKIVSMVKRFPTSIHICILIDAPHSREGVETWEKFVLGQRGWEGMDPNSDTVWTIYDIWDNESWEIVNESGMNCDILDTVEHCDSIAGKIIDTDAGESGDSAFGKNKSCGSAHLKQHWVLRSRPEISANLGKPFASLYLYNLTLKF